MKAGSAVSGNEVEVVVAMSGGVDSSVTAALTWSVTSSIDHSTCTSISGQRSSCSRVAA